MVKQSLWFSYNLKGKYLAETAPLNQYQTCKQLSGMNLFLSVSVCRKYTEVVLNHCSIHSSLYAYVEDIRIWEVTIFCTAKLRLIVSNLYFKHENELIGLILPFRLISFPMLYYGISINEILLVCGILCYIRKGTNFIDLHLVTSYILISGTFQIFILNKNE